MDTLGNKERQIDWEEMIVRLLAFTRSLAKGKAWFRGQNTTSFLMGKEAEDYTYGAISKYLEEPEKYDAGKGELLDYLKYNLVRSLVANDLRKKENRSTNDVFAVNSEEDENENVAPYLDRVLPHVEALFPDTIDYEDVKRYIESEVQGDKDAENVFLGLYSYGMKRGGIIMEFEMVANDYDNGMRRLNTIINRAAKHFNNNPQAV